MIYVSIFLLMIFSWFVFYLERFIPERYHLIIVSFVIFCMVVVAATKPDTSADYDNYYNMFCNYDDPKEEFLTEPTYLLIARIIHLFGGNFDILLWVYAILSIPLKVYVFKSLSSFRILFLALPLYLATFFPIQDCEQIRIAAAMSFMLFAYLCRVRKYHWITWVVLWIIATLFHYTSVVAVFPIIFYSEKPLTLFYKCVLSGFVILGVIIWIFKVNIVAIFPIPIIEAKMAIYDESISRGNQLQEIVLYHHTYLLRYLTFFYVLYFYETINKHIKGLNMLLLVEAFGLFCWGGLSGIAVFSVRISELFLVPEAILFASVIYTIKPYWVGYLYPIIVTLFVFILDDILTNQFGLNNSFF